MGNMNVWWNVSLAWMRLATSHSLQHIPFDAGHTFASKKSINEFSSSTTTHNTLSIMRAIPQSMGNVRNGHKIIAEIMSAWFASMKMEFFEWAARSTESSDTFSRIGLVYFNQMHNYTNLVPHSIDGCQFAVELPHHGPVMCPIEAHRATIAHLLGFSSCAMAALLMQYNAPPIYRTCGCNSIAQRIPSLVWRVWW